MKWLFKSKNASCEDAACEVEQIRARQKKSLDELDQVNARVLKALLRHTVDKDRANG